MKEAEPTGVLISRHAVRLIKGVSELLSVEFPNFQLSTHRGECVCLVPLWNRGYGSVKTVISWALVSTLKAWPALPKPEACGSWQKQAAVDYCTHTLRSRLLSLISLSLSLHIHFVWLKRFISQFMGICTYNIETGAEWQRWRTYFPTCFSFSILFFLLLNCFDSPNEDAGSSTLVTLLLLSASVGLQRVPTGMCQIKAHLYLHCCWITSTDKA